MTKDFCEKCRAKALKKIETRPDQFGGLVPVYDLECKLSENKHISEVYPCPVSKFILNNIWFKLEHQGS